MTQKRFQKLFRSEMTKLMQHQEGAGVCIRSAANATLNNFNNYNSYQKAWDSIRVLFIRPNNKIVPIS
jgi:hypothetical protein